MSEAFAGRWKWLERANMLTTIVVALVPLGVAVIGWISYEFGQRSQAQTLNRYIEGMIEQVPAAQRDRVTPVISAVKDAVHNAIDGRTGETALAQSANDLTAAITSVPTTRYSIGNEPTFSLAKGATALFCDNKQFINYRGPNFSYSPNKYNIYVDGRGWAMMPGDLWPFPSGSTIRLMEARDSSVVFNVVCKQN